MKPEIEVRSNFRSSIAICRYNQTAKCKKIRSLIDKDISSWQSSVTAYGGETTDFSQILAS